MDFCSLLVVAALVNWLVTVFYVSEQRVALVMFVRDFLTVIASLFDSLANRSGLVDRVSVTGIVKVIDVSLNCRERLAKLNDR